MTEESFMATQVAGKYLAENLPHKSPEQWALWLRNNRNNSRPAVYRVPTHHIGRGAFYLAQELDSFIEFEKTRQLGTVTLSAKAVAAMKAFGIGEPGGTTQGRSWSGASANLVTTGNSASVQTVISDPLMVFVMTPEQAVEWGKELIDAGQAAQRINKPTESNPSDYEIISDTPQAIIMRRKS